MEGYVLAGYVVADPVVGADWVDRALVGREITSVSNCLVDVRELDEWSASPVGAEVAGELVRRYPGTRVLAVGVADADVDGLVEDLDEACWDPDLRDRLRRRAPFLAGAPLGFEPVGPDGGSFHTWLCLGGLVDSARQVVGVEPGRHGLVQDEGRARAAAAHLTEAFPYEHEVARWFALVLAGVEPGSLG
ncbi:hypothetical protein L6E12_19800 [Actinokineospora sp. PR83]|uniref:hypothetical protein n=1 Tax=Actinokineospora sp. PR83 TaxID=2884908 RepID=UPI001F295008|nr:hypothetical protein [Actinokineospora sp. PR83]MCG8918029.1 hypothetical protein [Actinokineospora sp. PR83]